MNNGIIRWANNLGKLSDEARERIYLLTVLTEETEQLSVVDRSTTDLLPAF